MIARYFVYFQNNPGATTRENRPGLVSRDPHFVWKGIRIDEFITDPGYGDLMTDDPEMDRLDRDQCAPYAFWGNLME